MAKLKLTPVELLERYPLNEKRGAVIRANHLAGRHDWPRPICPDCMAGEPYSDPPKYQSLYPELGEIALCGRCHCWHFPPPSRCFVADPAFLDIALGPRSRMTSIRETGVKVRSEEELAAAERQRREQRPSDAERAPWWTT